MRDIFTSGLLLALHLLLFLCLGSLTIGLIGYGGAGKAGRRAVRNAKTDGPSGMAIIGLNTPKYPGLCEMIICGYFLWFALCEVIIVPAIFAGLSTQHLGECFAIIALCTIGAGIVLCRHIWRQRLTLAGVEARSHSWMLPVILAGCLACVLAAALYADGSQDAALYVGMSSTAAYTNTLEKYSAFTGAAKNAFNARYVFFGYPMYAGALARITGLQAIIIARTIMPVIHMLMCWMIIGRLAGVLLQDKDRKLQDFMVLLFFALLLTGQTIYLPGTFFFTRLYEGKTLIANLCIPMITLCMIAVWKAASTREEIRAFLQLFFCNLAAMCFSGSGFIGAFTCLSFSIPVLVKKRKAGTVLYLLVSMLPYAVVGCLYLLAKTHRISMKIR